MNKYQKRIAAGLCGTCGTREVLGPEKPTCQHCLDMAKKRITSVTRPKRIERGLCSACGTRENRGPGKTTCQRCLDLQKVRIAAIRLKQIEQGICTKCGKYPAEPQKRGCTECLKKAADGQAQVRKHCLDNGLCMECKTEVPMGQHYCSKCKVRHSSYGAEKRIKKRHVILERDGFACRICNNSTNRLVIHHIDGNGRYMAKTYNPSPNNISDNLITLCFHCHSSITLFTHASHPDVAIFLIQEYLRNLPRDIT